MSEDLVIDKSKTALVVIDLQKGITALPSRPYTTQEVISNVFELVNAFRKNKMPVFLVHVDTTKDTSLNVISDLTFSRPQPASPDWAEFIPELAPTQADIVITKRQWGAYNVLCGIATDFGVESTARFAYEYGYQQILAEDAMASRSDEHHNATINFIFKRMGRVRKTGEILETVKQRTSRE